MFYRTEAGHFLRMDNITRVTPSGDGANIYLDCDLPTFTRHTPEEVVMMIFKEHRRVADKARAHRERSLAQIDKLIRLLDERDEDVDDEPEEDNESEVFSSTGTVTLDLGGSASGTNG